jgi:hypothetical protein
MLLFRKTVSIWADYLTTSRNPTHLMGRYRSGRWSQSLDHSRAESQRIQYGLRDLNHSLYALAGRMIWSELEKSDRPVPIGLSDHVRCTDRVPASTAVSDSNDNVSRHLVNMNGEAFPC